MKPIEAPAMHPNAALLMRLYTALDRHDDREMAACYHPDAHFRDIAFDLHGIDKVGAMWRMICRKTDIRTTFEILDVDDRFGKTALVDTYSYPSDPCAKQRQVRNEITSHLHFQDGLIIEHIDCCNARAWGEAALGGLKGFLAGRLRILRSVTAQMKLRRFMKEYGIKSCTRDI
jgi:ketosteroid isomerase-like protein